jgi:hypothetical protein
MSHMTFLPPKRAIRLNNSTCPYCGADLATVEHNTEHAVGRKFVPKGTLDGCWNLILHACVDCNHRKSQLEDDLSAITMQPDAYGQHHTEDPVLVTEASRKANNSISRRTRRPVANSIESQEIEVALGPGIQLTVSFTMPPQADTARMLELAKMHLCAFFYWITYDRQTRKGGFWTGEGAAIDIARKGDWGNTRQRSFIAAVADWERRVHAVTAAGYFKLAIRRNPNVACWSWALEWNQGFRLIGAFGEPSAINELATKIEEPAMREIRHRNGSISRMRQDVPLSDADDRLFSCDSPVV